MMLQAVISLLILANAVLCNRVVFTPELAKFIGNLEYYTLKPNAVVIVVDESGSIGAQTYEEVKHFTNLVARHFSVTSEHSRIAVVSFANVPRTHVNFIQNSQGTNMCTLLKVINDMGYVAQGTHTSLAMEEARKILVQARPNANKIIILITDGESNGGYSPLKEAERLKAEGVTIFAVGVASINKEEVEGVATSLGHVYMLTDFNFIKDLNAFLKKETKEVSWDYTPDSSFCDGFCDNKTDCCDNHAKCYCGTRGGDYECVCDAGYQGTGHKRGCQVCPKGTYKSTYGKLDCTKCPEHSTTAIEASTSFADCECEVGYEMKGNYCKPIECAKLDTPDGGILVPTNCDNIYGSKCTFKCREGYCPYSCQMSTVGEDPSVLPWNRSPLPVKQCLETGKWSGESFHCEKMRCPVLDPPLHGRHNCTGLHFVFGTSCQLACEAGYDLQGSNFRTCLVNGTWTGSPTRCEEIKCEPLKHNRKLKVKPKRCSSQKMPFKSVCRYYCTDGYNLVSKDGKHDGINECLSNKTWSNAGVQIACADVSPPNITCPSSIVKNTDPSKATATVAWEGAVANDNVFVSSVLIKSPNFIKKPPYSFPIGTTKIVYEAFDNSNHSNTCSFTVTVIDKELPQVSECPEDITIFHDKRTPIPVNWKEPVFWDNSGKLNPPLHVRKSGDEFSWGDASTVFYNVSDSSGNAASCQFNVKIKRHSCLPFVPPANGIVTCDQWEDGRLCSVYCPEGYRFASTQYIPNAFECKRVNKTSGKWAPFQCRNCTKFRFPIPDCARIQKRNAVNETIQMDFEVDVCNEEVVKKMREKFINTLQKSFNPHISGVICPAKGRCKPGNVDITCGNARLKRSVDAQNAVLSVKFNIEMYPDKGENVSEITSKVSDTNEASVNASQPFLKEIETLASQNVKEVYSVDSIKAPKISYQIDLICSLGQIRNDNSCIDCPAGTYKDDISDACVDCPHATYQDTENSFSCLPCPQGYTTYQKRSKTISDCKAPCQPGTYSRTTFEPCHVCPLHTYQEWELGKDCLKCPNGLFTWRVGSNSSKDCVSPCQPGSFSDTGLEPCTLCDFGFYQNSSQQNSCEECPVGTSTRNKGSIAVEKCQKVDACEELQPCSNGSTCMSHGNSYLCVCPYGSLGERCEQTLNFCESDSCTNGGTCVSVLGDYKCLCPVGYSGLNCEINVDDCKNDSCNNNGECIDLINGFSCVCDAGYTGERCEVNIYECASDPCRNGGTCFDKVNGYKCCCPAGFVGENCALELDPCEEVTCQNGGTCIPDGTGYVCDCEPQFKGIYCEEKIDQCLNYTCYNDGACVNGFDHPYCKCPLGYNGTRCETELIPEYSLNFKNPTTSNFVKLENKEFLYSITVAFFMRTELTDPEKRPTPVSYSYYDKEKEELVDNALTVYDVNKIVLYLHGETLHTGYIANGDANWHHYAVTWEKDRGKWSFYVDGKSISSGLHVGERRYFWPGFFILGQEQDSLGGTFSMSEAFAGDITEFNVWNFALSEEEIKSISSTCGIVGNVIPWVIASVHIHGSVTISSDVSICKGIGTCSAKDCYCFYSTENTSEICKHSVQSCNPNPCSYSQECVATDSRHHCSCDVGYEGKLCEYDLNECLENNGGCSHVCVNTPGYYECQCPEGMILSKDGFNCQDINFCKVGEQIFLDGENWISDCQKCICEQGNVQCFEMQCVDTTCYPGELWVQLPGNCCPKCVSYAFCSISTNNSLLTFDFSTVEVSNICDFTLIEDCVNGQFSVRMESKHNFSSHGNLVIHQDCQQLRVSEDGEVTFNNDSMVLPFKNEDFHIKLNNESIDIWMKSGLNIQWISEEILVAVPVERANRLCGLCGNYQDHHMRNTDYNFTESKTSEKQVCIIHREETQEKIPVSKSNHLSSFTLTNLFQCVLMFLTYFLMCDIIHLR